MVEMMNIICNNCRKTFMSYIFHKLFKTEKKMNAQFWLGNLFKIGILEDCEGDGRITLR
jgi:hypothetical protein